MNIETDVLKEVDLKKENMDMTINILLHQIQLLNKENHNLRGLADEYRESYNKSFEKEKDYSHSLAKRIDSLIEENDKLRNLLVDKDQRWKDILANQIAHSVVMMHVMRKDLSFADIRNMIRGELAECYNILEECSLQNKNRD